MKKTKLPPILNVEEVEDMYNKPLELLPADRLYYLASPYTGNTSSKRMNKKIEKQRLIEITRLAAKLHKKYNLPLITPITSSAAIRDADPTINHTWDEWQHVDTVLVEKSDVLLIAMMPGVHMSRGVTSEIQIAKRKSIPILCIDPLTLAVWKY